MRNVYPLLKRTLPLLGALWLSGCQGTVPVAVGFPKAPPPPQGPTERAKSALTAKSLTERYDDLDREFQDSLQKAVRP